METTENNPTETSKIQTENNAAENWDSLSPAQKRARTILRPYWFKKGDAKLKELQSMGGKTASARRRLSARVRFFRQLDHSSYEAVMRLLEIMSDYDKFSTHMQDVSLNYFLSVERLRRAILDNAVDKHGRMSVDKAKQLHNLDRERLMVLSKLGALFYQEKFVEARRLRLPDRETRDFGKPFGKEADVVL